MVKVPGEKDGIKRSNRTQKKVEPVLSVKELKEKYLFGVEIFDNEDNEIKDSTLQQYIDNAISMIELDLDISITPVYDHIEEKDYRLNDYADWGFLMLNNYPVISVSKMEMVFFRDEDGLPQTVQEIPSNWIRVQNHDGIIRLIPNARFPASLQVGQSGNFFPEILRTNMIPNLWRLTYDYGFEDGKVPSMLNQMIGYIAAIQALIIAGNLVIGAGIASESLSIDGLNQNIVTTASAENSSYSAQIKEYQRILYGSTKDDPTALIKILRAFYKGEQINII